jgi:hemerythrin
MEEGSTAEMINLVTTAIGDWLENHIKGDDFHMTAFIKERDVN